MIGLLKPYLDPSEPDQQDALDTEEYEKAANCRKRLCATRFEKHMIAIWKSGIGKPAKKRYSRTDKLNAWWTTEKGDSTMLTPILFSTFQSIIAAGPNPESGANPE